LEQRLAALEGAEACMSTASGMSAILLMCMGLLKAGDHVICSHSMFGSTIKLIGTDLAKFGVESSFVSQTDVAAWKAAIRPSTRLLFAETPTNPLTDVCDIRALADRGPQRRRLALRGQLFCHASAAAPHGAGCRHHHALRHQIPGRPGPRDGRRAVCQPGVGDAKSFLPVMKSAGMTLAPFNAWVVLKGLETLDIRMQAQSARALALAQWLQVHPAVARVHYPGLTSHPQHELAMAQQSGCGGAVLSFEVKAAPTPTRPDASAPSMCSIRCRCCRFQPTWATPRHCVAHPASTSHGRLTEAQRQLPA
jgi:O-succinylhomoserine sulfhydrylase